MTFNIKNFMYTPDEVRAIIENYKPDGRFHCFVFFGREVPFHRAALKLGMSTIQAIRQKFRPRDGDRFCDEEEEVFIKMFLINAQKTSPAAVDTSLAAIWLLAQNNLTDLAQLNEVPDKDCVSVRIVFDGNKIHTLFSHFSFPELAENIKNVPPLF